MRRQFVQRLLRKFFLILGQFLVGVVERFVVVQFGQFEPSSVVKRAIVIGAGARLLIRPARIVESDRVLLGAERRRFEFPVEQLVGA